MLNRKKRQFSALKRISPLMFWHYTEENYACLICPELWSVKVFIESEEWSGLKLSQPQLIGSAAYAWPVKYDRYLWGHMTGFWHINMLWTGVKLSKNIFSFHSKMWGKLELLKKSTGFNNRLKPWRHAVCIYLSRTQMEFEAHFRFLAGSCFLCTCGVCRSGDTV